MGKQLGQTISSQLGQTIRARVRYTVIPSAQPPRRRYQASVVLGACATGTCAKGSSRARLVRSFTFLVHLVRSRRRDAESGYIFEEDYDGSEISRRHAKRDWNRARARERKQGMVFRPEHESRHESDLRLLDGVGIPPIGQYEYQVDLPDAATRRICRAACNKLGFKDIAKAL